MRLPEEGELICGETDVRRFPFPDVREISEDEEEPGTPPNPSTLEDGIEIEIELRTGLLICPKVDMTG